jgi:hypothetical protein
MKGCLSCIRAGIVSALLPLGMVARADTLPARSGDEVCFQRNYTLAHLSRNARQQVTAFTMSLRWERIAIYEREAPVVRLSLQRRGSKGPERLVGSCAWTADANSDGSGNALIPAYPRRDGIGCMTKTGTDLDEEGAYFLVSIAPGGGASKVYLGDGLIVSDAGRRGDKGRSIDLGGADRVFALPRVSNAVCRDLVRSAVFD